MLKQPQQINGMQIVGMAARALHRDWQAGELRVLAAALCIAVASVAAVGCFTDRVQQALERQASELLGADLIVSATRPMQAQLEEEAQRRGLRTAHTMSFRSVVLVGERTQLTEVKAVSSNYPLRGSLQISDGLFAAAQDTSTIPQRGTLWGDARLLQTLGIAVGASLNVGASSLTLAQVLAYEPDRGGDAFSLAPRVLMNRADVEATQLIQPGSRVEYRLLLAGEAAAVEGFKTWAQARLQEGEKLQGLAEARLELRSALERGQRFLHLAALVSVLLAGVGIALAVRSFAARHWDSVAILRCLGARQALITRLFIYELLALTLLAGLGGLALGYAAQYVLSALLGTLVSSTTLPPATWWPAAAALLTGLITMLGFGLPSLLRLRQVPPLRVLRRDLGPLPVGAWLMYAPALLASAALLSWQAGTWRLALYSGLGIGATVIVLGLAASALVRVLQLLRGQVGVTWRFGLANIARRGVGSTVQVVALGLGLLALLLLAVVRGDLLASWQASLPAHAPNHFLINVQPAQVAGVQTFLQERGLGTVALYPMVRGRWTALNEQAVIAENYANPRAKRLAAREFNLSWNAALPEDNRVVAGTWWTAAQHGEALASVEVELAKDLGIRIGDRLRFHIADQALTVRVTSLREVQWDSFHPNFFVLLPPQVLETYPATWISSFYLPPERKPVLAELVRAYPSVTVLDVAALMDKVREIAERVTLAVEYVFLFTLLAGLSVLYAALQATQHERQLEGAVLRALGASRRMVQHSLLAEFATLGLLAGLLAAAAATLLGALLAQQVFGFAYHGSWWVWLLGGAAGMGGVGGAGVWGARSTLKQAPWVALRNS